MKINNPPPLHHYTSADPAGPSNATPQALDRSKSEGTLRGLAELAAGRPRQRDEPTAHRRRASLSGELPDPNVPAPALHEMIGRARAGALDAKFGSLQPVLNLATDGIRDWEREGGEHTGKR